MSALERMVLDGIFERSRDGKLSKEGHKSFSYAGAVISYNPNSRVCIFYLGMMEDFGNNDEFWPVKVRREIERSAETRPASICNTVTITTISNSSLSPFTRAIG